jgi:uncharacterized protein (TIGR02270 family)
MDPHRLSRIMPNAIPVVLAQHLEVAVHLAGTRRHLLGAPHVTLRQLRRSDDRLAAHLDGLNVAGDEGKGVLQGSLVDTDAATVFVVCSSALVCADRQQIGRLLAIVEAEPAALPGLTAAFGWVEPAQLQGVVSELLDAGSVTARVVGLAACAWHRVNPGLRIPRGLEDSSPDVRARALRCAGELGLAALVSTCAAATDDPVESCRFWAAWAAVLLGDRRSGERRAPLEVLATIGSAPGPLQARAFSLAIQAMNVSAARGYVEATSKDPASLRRKLSGAGLVGDPADVPWLIDLMEEDSLARLAGEVFSLITGADLAALDLERRPPEGFESGPDDDPEHSNVGMDEDDGLPWPEPARVRAWWAANSPRFQPGVRHFMGEPLNADNCLRVLRAGYQRQRIAAALYLSLLNPGSSLFEWRAPAQRQQRLLAS